jgi:general secretion pathway protein B
VSYILDALRKAERDRQASPVPTLTTAHAGAESVRRLPGVWAVGGGLALSAIVAYGLFWASGRPDAVRESTRPPLAVARPAASGASAAPGGPSLALERPPERAAVPPTLAPGVAVERLSGGDAPARPPVASVAPPTKGPRAADDRRRGPSAAGLPGASETRSAALARPHPTPPAAAPGREPVTEPRPADAPGPPPAIALAPGPPPDTKSGRALPQFALDVLVYSDVPAERLVFINGRKYVEGQPLDSDTVLEQITPEGAVLRHQGKPLVLRPKLNPYARPGSP